MFGDIGRSLGLGDDDSGGTMTLIGAGVGGYFGGPTGAMIGGQIGSGFDNRLSQGKVNKQQINLSHDQMKFQERMSSTAYQRQVKDLEAAGLNPMLGVMKGSGASSPAGSMAQLKAPQLNIDPAVATAMQKIRMKKEFQQIDAAIEQAQAQAKKLKTENQAVEAQNEARKQEAKFYKDNPWALKVKLLGDSFGLNAGSAMQLGAGYMLGSKGKKGKIDGGYKGPTKYKYKNKNLRKFNKSPKNW